jgi:uncharacterized membrane protein YeaQ/YmgE (transglycosylase-associated protein family)
MEDFNMNWLVWILFGGLAGWVANMLSKNKSRNGLITNIIVGVAGSWVGGFLMSLLGAQGVTGFNLRSFVIAVIGSVALLWVFNKIRGK